MINMEYRQGFVKCVREENIVYVLNDLNYVDSYWTQTKSDKEFDEECKSYLASDKFQEKLKQQRGY